MDVFSAKVRRSSHASAWRTPWPARMTGRFAFGDLGRGRLELAAVAVEVRTEAREAGDDLILGRVLGARLLLERVLRDVDVDRTRATGPGDVEGLRHDPRQLVGVAHQVVVLRHRQGDAVDVDLLEGVLADERGWHVARDRDHRHRIEHRGPDPRDEVRGTGAGGAHADPDRPGDPGVPVGRVGAALLVADQDVAKLRVVAQDVVQRQDHAARVAEEDVDALAKEGLAQDVRPDARPLEVACLMEHALPGALDRRRARRAVGRHVTASARGGTRRFRGIGLHRHWQALVVTDIQKTLAYRRGSLRVMRGSWRLSVRSSASLRSPAGSR